MTKTLNTTEVVYLGPAGTYTEIAAENLIKEKTDIKNFDKTPKATIIQVIKAVDNDRGKIGVVPIENSIEGIVRETVDNLITSTSRVMITGEIIVPISHCLMSKGNDIFKIDKVLSKDQALAQCLHFMAKHLKDGVEKIPVSSTSEAARQIAELPENYAAIASYKAAEIYGLNILAKNINDEKDNLTRFVSLGAKTLPRTGNDKTSIAFSARNESGALVDILLVFKENDINLSYIESRPSKKVFGDYTFFIDFEGHIEDENVQKTIGKIAPMINFYRILGSFPKGKTVSF